MALHDVDKTNATRTTPMPNSADNNTNRLAHGTFSISLESENADAAAIISIKDGTISILRADGTKMAELTTARTSDSAPAVDVAKPGLAL
jgi:hypothetical protein